ncbi:methionine ABC transporter ATP-binding protein [Paenibacillus periandrae]|uniref:methionine ABC transporter ATP-binding protein n=1 Tax=Paenibacillus periandrae TaxID=1761741 RepID=UPI001F09EE6D|nr:methionine ABC transporter ATP-binding protein [Paenibacillus periandrae]
MISLQEIDKTYSTPSGPLHAVKSASLEIEKGDIFGIIGFSGAGKSTLLRTINLLERPDHGKVIVDGKDFTSLSRKELLKERQAIGMIFQHFQLLTNRTVYENISFPLEIAGISKKERKPIIDNCLRILELEDKSNAYPTKLSGGQKQRVAIARAIANNPKVLLCDEPTSSVDPQTTESILNYLKGINTQLGITIVIVTHEMDVIKSICNHVAVMEQGAVVENFSLNHPGYIPKSNIAKYLYKQEDTMESRETHYV